MGTGLSWNSDCHWVSLHCTSVFLSVRIPHGGGAELKLGFSWVSLHYKCTSVFLLFRIPHVGGTELEHRLSLGNFTLYFCLPIGQNSSWGGAELELRLPLGKYTLYFCLSIGQNSSCGWYWAGTQTVIG